MSVIAENLSHKYGNLTALHELNLQVGPGEVFGLIGPNGAGKTTTLKILATLLRPSHGTVSVCGFKLPGQAGSVRRCIGYMPDNAGIYEDMQVDEYLRFFAAACDLRGAKAEGTIGDVLELTDLVHKREAQVESLSRGMRQRLGVARVLLHDPQVLLLDEPASGLDPRARVEMRMLLRELRSMGKSILISSHILSELAEICTGVGIMEAGKVLFQGTLDELILQCRSTPAIRIRVGGHNPDTDLDCAMRLLAEDPRVAQVELADDALLVHLSAGNDDAGFLPSLLIRGGFLVRHFAEEPLTLEEAFMRLTQGIVK